MPNNHATERPMIFGCTEITAVSNPTSNIYAVNSANTTDENAVNFGLILNLLAKYVAPIKQIIKLGSVQPNMITAKKENNISASIDSYHKTASSSTTRSIC